MRSFVQPEGSMKARIIAKQKCKFIIDAEIVESLIGGLLFDKPNDEDEQFRTLRLAFQEQSGFREMLRNAQQTTAVQSFEQCWAPLGNDYEDQPKLAIKE